MIIDGKTWRQVNSHVTYSVVNVHSQSSTGSLVDRGANGGIAGSDGHVIYKNASGKSVDVCGIDNHQVTNIPLATVGVVVQSQHGEVIAILNQYAYTGKGKTIHPAAQLERGLHPLALYMPLKY